jgi:hypothetical protein
MIHPTDTIANKRQRELLATSTADGSVTRFASCGHAAAHCRPDIKLNSAKATIYVGLRDSAKDKYGYFWKYADTVEDPDVTWMPVHLENADGWQVSDSGQVKSPAGRVQSGCVRRDGHVNVEINGKTLTLHSVIAAAFLPSDDDHTNIIAHIDDDKTNNHASNLKRVSRSKLMLDKMAQAPNALKAVDQFTTDMVFVESHKSMADANRSIGRKAGHSGIKTCVAGKTEQSGGFVWKPSLSVLE